MTSPLRRPTGLRPAAEALEDRRLLSQTVSGTDAKGDTWTLQLIGPGALTVIKQPDASGNPQSLTSPSDIQQIVVGGAEPFVTRLVGKVTSVAPGSDGRVFFQNLQELGGPSQATTAGGNGLLAIDMPGFWLGNTSATGAAINQTTPTIKASISIPDGVNSLRFGGADTTFFNGTNASSSVSGDNTSDQFIINLGLPAFLGTTVIVNKMVSSAQPATGTNGATSPTQNSIVVNVAGRLNLFQANEIDGNSSLYQADSRFLNTNLLGNTVNQNQGGTIILSTPITAATVTGYINNVRVGGNATNLSVQTNGHIGNFYVGGETQNVSLLGPGDTRNVYFGRGMDQVTINSHVIDNLQANRGALDSTVITDRTIARASFGGDVVNTQVLSGYQQNLTNVFQTQQFPSTALPNAQDGGGMTVLVAGDVTNSVFAASAQPDPSGLFGTSNDLLFPHGHISAKVEGNISNTTATPSSPTKAFYAQNVSVVHGPVQPPNVPEPPFGSSVLPTRAAGLRPLPGQRLVNPATLPAATIQGYVRDTRRFIHAVPAGGKTIGQASSTSSTAQTNGGGGNGRTNPGGSGTTPGVGAASVSAAATTRHSTAVPKGPAKVGKGKA
ncbi:MAG TPA: hypothetical protein VG406_20520 [Isosphaeraceae bacterium]|jgi:hypothetical protein|nr:hypothetical protein [Isosphaeraceae bacterium]